MSDTKVYEPQEAVGVEGLGFMVYRFGLRVQGLGFSVGLGLRGLSIYRFRGEGPAGEAPDRAGPAHQEQLRCGGKPYTLDPKFEISQAWS